MQNEACIKQGSEKESFRQQLNDAKAVVKYFYNCPEFDDAENHAVMVILEAAEQQRMSPRAFLQAAEAIRQLDAAKSAVLNIGYSVVEMEPEDGKQLYQAVKEYSTRRAVVLGFEKSLTPSGWDILED